MVLEDGFPTTITVANAPTLAIKCKEVTPPGVEAGGKNDQTTMHNNTRRTARPKKLKSYTDAAITCAYDPAIYDDVDAQVGVNQLLTVSEPDDSSISWWGWIDSFKPDPHIEGTQPTAKIVLIASNLDDDGVEQGITYTPAP